MIELKDFMSKPVIWVKPDDKLTKAVTKMVKHGVGDVVVSHNGRYPCGIITERDILQKVTAKGRDVNKVFVREFMTKRVKSLPVNSTVMEVSRLMAKGNFRRVVLMRNGKMAGIMTSRDLIRMMAGE